MTGIEIVVLLERALADAEADLQGRVDSDKAQFPGSMYVDSTPWNQKDRNGRYILLDALAVVVHDVVDTPC